MRVWVETRRDPWVSAISVTVSGFGGPLLKVLSAPTREAARDVARIWIEANGHELYEPEVAGA